jgi:thiol-disulfide isomerase/thioredoxin
MLFYILMFFIILGAAFTGFYFGFEHVTGSSPFESTPPDALSTLSTAADGRLVLFGVHWCPYSKRMKAIWQNVFQKYDGTTVNDVKLKVEYVDAEADKRQANLFKVVAYPTVKLIMKDRTYSYSGPSRMDALDSFVESATRR